jgi:hypothetical protein
MTSLDPVDVMIARNIAWGAYEDEFYSRWEDWPYPDDGEEEGVDVAVRQWRHDSELMMQRVNKRIYED